MRRIAIEEPVTRFALWSRRMGWMALGVAGIAAILVRSGRIDAGAGAAAILSGAGFASLAVLLALAAFARIWSEGRKGLAAALTGFALGAAILAPPAAILAIRHLAPQPLDVATDAQDPPAFSTAPGAVAARGGWTGPTGAPADGAEIGAPPLLLDLPFPDVVAIARRAAAAQGLRVIEEPTATAETDEPATIEASGRTLVLRLPLELTIRVTPIGERAKVDARAAAPRGNHDLSGNVALLRAYLDEVAFIAELR